MFVSLVYAVLNPVGEVVYVNGGHNPPLLYRRGGGQLLHLERTGMVLGLFDGVGYEQVSFQMEPGDILLMYTDGVSEATAANDEEFGLERLQLAFLERVEQPLTELVGGIQADIDAFTGSYPQFDDITLLVARRV
jgi:sigma-B regulation protein RsbU (phosphoserine phosphatase)